jgi:hypothetical protein
MNYLVISYLCGIATIPLPLLSSSGYSLSHQCSYFIWPTWETTTTTMLRTIMGRTTRMSTHHHPLHLLLSKCWLCKQKCFKPCNKPWSTCKLLNLKHHHRGIGLGIFSALSHQHFLMLWSQWMLRTGSSGAHVSLWTVATRGASVVHGCRVIRLFPLQGWLLILISVTPSEMGDACSPHLNIELSTS